MQETVNRRRYILVNIFREAIGLGVALVSIGWVLLHLVGFLFHGYILVGESNPFILVIEITLVLGGLFCFLTTLCEDKLTKKG